MNACFTCLEKTHTYDELIYKYIYLYNKEETIDWGFKSKEERSLGLLYLCVSPPLQIYIDLYTYNYKLNLPNRRFRTSEFLII